MKTTHLFSLSVGTRRLSIVVLHTGISFGYDGISFMTKTASWVWLWPWCREVPGHPYVNEIGIYYRTLRELKANKDAPNVAIAFDRINRIH